MITLSALIEAAPKAGAWFSRESPKAAYRYALWRVWDATKPLLMVVMYNPSKADGVKNDNTMIRVIYFASLWGFGGVVVVNCHAIISSKPSVVKTMKHRRIHVRTSALAVYQAAKITDTRVLVAFGRNAEDEGWRICHELQAQGKKLYCLGRTKEGHPKHPLARGKHWVPNDQQMEAFTL